MFRLARTAAALVAAGVLAGCVRPVAAPGEVGAGRPAPPTEGSDADGQPLLLADQQGKVVLLAFWHAS
jgi:hypothetical protein